MNTEDIFKLCDLVRETGFAIHRYHRNGHLEKVYQNALVHRLRKQLADAGANVSVHTIRGIGYLVALVRDAVG